ncbi:hypothetical protein V2J09_009766 [Rumex salicifolius]
MDTYISKSNLFHLSNLSSSFCTPLPATLNHLSEWMAATILAMMVVWRHDAEGLWAATGALVNVVFSIALKNVFNQPRPFPPKRSDSGMPSTHAQIIFYTLAFALLSMVEGLGMSQLSVILAGVALSFASYLSWLRVSEKYHTVIQVLVGAGVGSTFSLVWAWAWAAAVFDAFHSTMWVRILVSMGATAFCVVLFSVTRSKLSKYNGLTSKWV